MLKIKLANQTGGKAGKGHNRTSTIQVIELRTSCIEKQFRFNVGDTDSRLMAIKKAEKFIEDYEPV